jgi:phosphatidylserine/phosphatidylglycerophosphate/cardiolipin synthase-like enzyme
LLVAGTASGFQANAQRPAADHLAAVPEEPADPAGSTDSSWSNLRSSPPNASIVALYPNPVADGDIGEFLVIDTPANTTLGHWTITDDSDQRVTLPNQTVSGRIAISHAPSRARNHTDLPVVRVDAHLGLANGGETVELRREGMLVDTVTYDDAPESERWQQSEDGGRWQPLGATAREPVTSDGATATAFVLPDGGTVAVDQLESADSRVLLAGYTLTADSVVRALSTAHDRGVAVSVLVDGSPVGGTSTAQVRALDRLAAAGIEVLVLGGEHARYAFHHAKYAVIDDRALVTTENWKPSGTGGRASRGWGVVLRAQRTADELAALFAADTGWRDTIPWTRYRETVDPVEAAPATETYRSAFDPTRVSVESARLLVTPDNAEGELRALFASATQSIRIQQVSIGGLDHPLLHATLAAARRGVTVEIQLSTAWYVEAENRKLATRLRSLAADEGLALSVTLVEPRSRFEKVHTKGVVVDDRHVVLGSINWNNHSLRDNREVALVLTGEEVAAYYSRVLTADRRGGVWRLPVGLCLVLVGVVVAVGWSVTRRVTWQADRWG